MIGHVNYVGLFLFSRWGTEAFVRELQLKDSVVQHKLGLILKKNLPIKFHCAPVFRFTKEVGYYNLDLFKSRRVSSSKPG